MGLFAYGGAADRYLEQVSSEEGLVDYILSELDEMFDTNASNLFLDNYVVQLWSNESYIRTGYTQYVAGDPGPIQVLQTPVDGKLFFAGEALPVDGESWGYAHGAALSGRLAAAKVLDVNPSTTRPPLDFSAASSSFGILPFVTALSLLSLMV
jgi:monoamine oxidase